MVFLDRAEVTRRFRRVGVREFVGAARLGLLAVLALLIARLIWAAAAPIGPIGTAPSAIRPSSAAADAAIFARFDPFFQLPGGADPLVVSDLNLDLFGTRVDNVSGRGSAIIGADGGQQRSFFVGEEVLPGVTLRSVAFDNVTISRDGALEQLFLDQSVPARTVAPPPAAPPAAPPVDAHGDPVVAASRIAREIATVPVMTNGRIDGLRLSPAADGKLFTDLGLKAGDVLVSVNRARISTKAATGNLADLLGDDRVAVLEIRRGAVVRTVSFEIAR